MNKKIFLSPPYMGGTEREHVAAAFASNYIAPCGPMVDAFEAAMAKRTGIPYMCAVSAGTAALDLIFHELDIQPGDRVLTSDLTFVASIAPAVHRGATPVFIDCDTKTWTIDCGLLETALLESPERPKAVVAVDLYGQCCDYEALEALCARFDVPLIIDAAEAVGATYRGRAAGDAGLAAVYSFNGNKTITTSGGGMLLSRDAGLVERARKRSQQSREPVVWYEHTALGYNYRMSNIVAAIGLGQLDCLDEIVAKKRQIETWYKEEFASCSDITFMPEAAYGVSSRWLSIITSPARDMTAIRERLATEAIESRPVWKPMHCQPVFAQAAYYGDNVATRLFETGLCLPSGAALSRDDVARVAAIVRRV